MIKSHTTREFRRLFDALPREIQERARKAYRLWSVNPSHPGLNFKQVDVVNRIYSARVGRDYRVLGTLHGDTVIWHWIGKHEEYERELKG